MILRRPLIVLLAPVVLVLHLAFSFKDGLVAAWDELSYAWRN